MSKKELKRGSSDIRQWLLSKKQKEEPKPDDAANDDGICENSDGFGASLKCNDDTSQCTSRSSIHDSLSSSVTGAASVADIGLAVDERHKLSCDKLFEFLTSTWVPEHAYQFPVGVEGNQTRKFQRQWLVDYDWLAYSKLKEGAFCKYCVLFASDGAGATHTNQVPTLSFASYVTTLQ
jgi:hypothetical protein